MTVTQADRSRVNSFSELVRGLFSRAPKKSARNMSHKDLFTDALIGGYRSYMVMPGQPVWMDRNYPQFALEAYIKNVIAHRSMSMVAGAAGSVGLKLNMVTPDGTRLPVRVHPLLDLLAKPNPTHAKGEFFKALHEYKLISGNAFIQAVGPQGESPSELHLLRPDRMAVIAGTGTMPAGYRYTVNNQYTDYPVNVISGRSQILHLKNFHPLNDWYGLSSVEAAAYSIDQHNQSGAWNQALLQNGARPSGALVVRVDSPGGGRLSEDQYNRVKLQIDEQFTGSANAGRPLLLEGGLDWKEMSMTPKDMDFVEAKNSAARDIALAFGVPPQLLGIPGDNTYSNLAEARLALWEQTVAPLVKMTVDALNSWLAPMFGDGLELCADFSDISALALRNQPIWDRMQTANFLTVDEKRAAVGYGPIPVAAKSRRAKRAKNKTAALRKDSEVEYDTGDDGGDDEGGGDTKPQAGADDVYDPYDPSSPYFDPDPTGYGDPYDDGSSPDPSIGGAGMVMDDSGKVYPADAPDTTIPDNAPSPLDMWGRPETLQGHYEDHGKDFGATSPEDYVNQSQQFLQDTMANDYPTIIDNIGNIRSYDADTNTFGSYNPDYTTRSFYSPNDGPQYFTDQTDYHLDRGGSLINGSDIPPAYSNIPPSAPEEPIVPEILIP